MSAESWCLMAFCPRHGPLRGDPKQGIHICEPHWKAIHEGMVDTLEAIKTHRAEFSHSSYIEWLRELDKMLRTADDPYHPKPTGY